MKTRILKKISQRIRIIEKNDMFVVQQRPNPKEEWHDINQYASQKKAVDKKNSYIVMVVMRDLGYRNEFVRRRVNRKKKGD